MPRSARLASCASRRRLRRPRPRENVIRWPGARAGSQWLRSDAGRVAGLFAASLLCGIYFGLSNVAQGALEDVAGITLGTSSGPTLAQLDPLDEDLL